MRCYNVSCRKMGSGPCSTSHWSKHRFPNLHSAAWFCVQFGWHPEPHASCTDLSRKRWRTVQKSSLRDHSSSGRGLSVFLSCSSESHFLQKTSAVGWTGTQNQVCTAPCVCGAAVFAHALKEGMYELKQRVISINMLIFLAENGVRCAFSVSGAEV